MAYTALKQMQNKNEELFGKGVGPLHPDRHYNTIDPGLKATALRFLHTRCEGLGFNTEIDALETIEGKFYGTSFLHNQIPYNMQMDINRLCL